jgi:hypothetical protein
LVSRFSFLERLKGMRFPETGFGSVKISSTPQRLPSGIWAMIIDQSQTLAMETNASKDKMVFPIDSENKFSLKLVCRKNP